MPVIAIAVVAANGVLGDGQDQPFKFKEDWARFKRTTMGHPLVAGRKTYDVMGLLPGRPLVVVTHDPGCVTLPDVLPSGASLYVADSIEGALEIAQGLDDIVFVIGGGTIYRAAWDLIDELDVTEVHAEAVGDVVFPHIDPQVWAEVSREPCGEFDFVRYQRVAHITLTNSCAEAPQRGDRRGFIKVMQSTPGIDPAE